MRLFCYLFMHFHNIPFTLRLVYKVKLTYTNVLCDIIQSNTPSSADENVEDGMKLKHVLAMCGTQIASSAHLAVSGEPGTEAIPAGAAGLSTAPPGPKGEVIPRTNLVYRDDNIAYVSAFMYSLTSLALHYVHHHYHPHHNFSHAHNYLLTTSTSSLKYTLVTNTTTITGATTTTT